jgi:hypothetical protein
MKTYKKLFTIFMLALMMGGISSCGPASRTIAIEEGWELIGETKINFVKDKEEIMVNSTHTFTDIRIKVENKPIVFHHVKIVFPNGDKIVPAMSKSIGKDQYSSLIHIAATGKQLRSIELKGRSTGNILKGRGRILIFGKRYTGY